MCHKGGLMSLFLQLEDPVLPLIPQQAQNFLKQHSFLVLHYNIGCKTYPYECPVPIGIPLDILADILQLALDILPAFS